MLLHFHIFDAEQAKLARGLGSGATLQDGAMDLNAAAFESSILPRAQNRIELSGVGQGTESRFLTQKPIDMNLGRCSALSCLRHLLMTRQDRLLNHRTGLSHP